MTADAIQVDTKGLAIRRDPKFFRTVADTVFVVPKGKELELCFIAMGPDPVFQQNDDRDSGTFQPGAVRLEASLADIGHVRLDEVAAANLAINLLSRLLDRGVITSEDLQNNVAELLKTHGAPAAGAAAADAPDGEEADAPDGR